MLNRLFAQRLLEINLTSTSLTQSKKKSPAAMRKEIELQIMDRGDVSIEKVAEQFLVEGSEIENRDGPYTADDYIPTSKNIPADFLHNFDQNEHYNYNEKEEEEKKEPQNEDDFSPKEKDGQSKGKMNKELHSLESYIKQGKSPSEIYKSNLVNLSRSTIFERCKRYKDNSSSLVHRLYIKFFKLNCLIENLKN